MGGAVGNSERGKRGSGERTYRREQAAGWVAGWAGGERGAEECRGGAGQGALTGAPPPPAMAAFLVVTGTVIRRGIMITNITF
jgi:hypothetical protein